MTIYREQAQVLKQLGQAISQAELRARKWAAMAPDIRTWLQEACEELSPALAPRRSVDQLEGQELGLRITSTQGPGGLVDHGAALRLELLVCGLVEFVYHPGDLAEAAQDRDSEPEPFATHPPDSIDRTVLASEIGRFCKMAVRDHWSNTADSSNSDVPK